MRVEVLLILMKDLKSREFLLKILGLQLIFYAVVFLNIPVARQVIGFVYLTFVPGIIITKLLKLGSLSWSRRIVFSVGFSIAFLLFVGLLINIIGPSIGISEPLSLIPLLATLSSIVLVLAFLSSYEKDMRHFRGTTISIDRKSVLLVVSLSSLPAVAIAGALLMNFKDNNLILLLLLATIPICFGVSVLSKKLTSAKLYTLMVLAIALALLFHSAFVSNYIMGADVQSEYYVFNLTLGSRFWSSTLPQFWDATLNRFNNMLSITILPAIYSSVWDIDPTWVFKILYPLIFSLVPVCLFLMWKPFTGMKRAFFSVFLFMAQLTFYTEMIGLSRQMIGELFLVLLFITLLSRKMGQFNTNLCFIVFGAALVVSHYSLSYIFLFFIAFACASSYVFKRTSRVTVSMVIIFFVMAFSWYIYASNAGSFNSFLSFGDNVISNIGDFANLSSRSQGVLTGMGLAASPTILNTVSRIIAYVTEALIVLGFFSTIAKLTNVRFSSEYIVFSWVSIGILAANVVLPRFAQTLNVERFYHISLFFLAPFFVIGAEFLIGILTDFASNLKFKPRQMLNREMRRKPTLLLLVIVVLYFLFQTNLIYVVARSESWSVPLSKQNLDPIVLHVSYGYIDESDVFAVRWLVKSIDFTHTTLFADATSIYNVLTSYGMIYRGDVKEISNTTKITTNGTVYMNHMNVVDGLIVGQAKTSNTSAIFPILNNMNKVYTNGGSEIYEKNQ